MNHNLSLATARRWCVAPALAGALAVLPACDPGEDPAAPQTVPDAGTMRNSQLPPPPSAESLYPLFERFATTCDALAKAANRLAAGTSLTAAESTQYNANRTALLAIYDEINDLKKANPRIKPKLREAFDAKARPAAEAYAGARLRLEAAVAKKKAGQWEKDPALDDPRKAQALQFKELDATATFGINAQ